MLATPAPATPLTNCRRDIVIEILPGTLRTPIGFVFIAWAIYPMDALNDQVITMNRLCFCRPAEWRCCLVQCDTGPAVKISQA
jgi:hypothetical protein